MNIIEQLRKRSLIDSLSKDFEKAITDKDKDKKIYLGIDPTYDSLHIGHMPCLIILKWLQNNGVKPIVVIGVATGMIGDPSGKSKERVLLDKETIDANQEKIKSQVEKFLDFDKGIYSAEILNNYSWTENKSFISFIRDIGKHITINYMMAKDSVKKRLDGSTEGISFTEFCYQLMQAYDFLHLYEKLNCRFQLGGADQWGNITTGIELIRKRLSGVCYGMTTPLLTKEDGSKFGKTEKGNIWLDKGYTSPFDMFQYWINTSDKEAEKLIKIFTTIPLNDIDDIIEEHNKDRGKRILQKTLAKQVIGTIHSPEIYDEIEVCIDILFSKHSPKDARDSLKKIDDSALTNVIEPALYNSMKTISKDDIIGIDLFELFFSKTGFLASKSYIRRAVEAGSLRINKEKVSSLDYKIKQEDIINDKFILIQEGKKKYFLIKLK